MSGTPDQRPGRIIPLASMTPRDHRLFGACVPPVLNVSLEISRIEPQNGWVQPVMPGPNRNFKQVVREANVSYVGTVILPGDLDLSLKEAREMSFSLTLRTSSRFDKKT